MPRQDIRFHVGANPLWLDFVNTERMAGGTRVDQIAKPADLGAWLEAADAAPTGPVGEAALQAAHALRKTLRRLAETSARGDPVPASIVRRIDAALRELPVRVRVMRRGAPKPVVELELAKKGGAAILWPILRSAAEWLQAGDPSLVKKCSNDDCILFFYDISKNHSRRWCSMTSCGNRAKARAFQRRHRHR